VYALEVSRPAQLRAVAIGAIAALGLFASLTPTHSSASTAWDRVVVSGAPGSLASVEHAVRAAGGQVKRTLGVIDGVAARVPAGAVPQLREAPGVRAVTPDAAGHLMGGADPVLGYDTTKDEGSLYDVAQVTHADDAWRFGVTGRGVDVALLDSGVAPVRGLTSGNVVNGPDLSFESQDPNLAHLDTYGHGTFMASVIAGRDQPSFGPMYANPNSHSFTGIAPDSRLISLKVAASDGSVDVSQVIAGIDWVVSHAQDPGFNIKVLNLSFGTDSTQDASVDPLDYAVENAWNAGITVVVSAGNDGTSRQQLADPANDPLVLAVGADDPNNTDNVNNDTVPAFAQRGTADRHVDLIAPGVHILGLRDPGSSIDQNNPSAVVHNRFFRGSGTSQSAAVVSGIAALYLSRYPDATPDQVKNALMTTADEPNVVRKLNAGVGVPDIAQALRQRPPRFSQPATGATGDGSLEAARGSNHVSDGTTELTGEQDIFGQPWNGSSWAAASAAGDAWDAGSWNGHAWTGSDWSGHSWTGLTWDGQAWTGSNWAGVDWASHAWTSHAWTDSSWDGHAWTDSGWDGHAWTDSDWASHAWTSAGWSTASWS
jgi:serine protease AprX